MNAYFSRLGVTLYLGDARDILPELGEVDHILTDPPYGRDVYQRLRSPNTKTGSGTPARLGIGNHQYRSTSLERLGAGFIGSVDELIVPCAAEFARICRRWALVFSDAETIHLWREALVAAGLRYVRTGAWVKPDASPQFSGDRPAVGFEPATICHAKGAMKWNGGGHLAVWTYNTVKGNLRERPAYWHCACSALDLALLRATSGLPTVERGVKCPVCGQSRRRETFPCPKPLPLMRELVSLFSSPGECILDPFAGSGTTLVAALEVRRRAIGIELDERYAEAIARRLELTSPSMFVDRGPARQLSLIGEGGA